VHTNGKDVDLSIVLPLISGSRPNVVGSSSHELTQVDTACPIGCATCNELLEEL